MADLLLTLKNDVVVTLRPIRSDDEPALRGFHGALSDRSVYQRYFHMLGLAFRTAHDRLAAVCAPDAAREAVYVLVHHDGGPDTSVVGVGRLTHCLGEGDAEFAVIVADAWQGIGAGTALLRCLMSAARDRGAHRLSADVLGDNHDMQRVCRACGFRLTPGDEPGVVRAVCGWEGPHLSPGRSAAASMVG